VFQQPNRSRLLVVAVAERFHRPGQRFHSFHFERAGKLRFGGQAACVLQFLFQEGVFPVAARDQDSNCHLRDAFGWGVSGLCHATLSKIRRRD
jgi:hypothetical protein